jgi:hypothetical protein
MLWKLAGSINYIFNKNKPSNIYLTDFILKKINIFSLKKTKKMEEIEQKNWFQRNWMWAVPIGGCGCGCIVVILFFVFGIGAALFGVSKIFDESTPVKYATELAYSNPKVMEALGVSIEKNRIPSGNISLNNEDGEIDFSIPIKGNKGEGTIIVKGIKADGKWVYEDLYVLIKKSQEQINLLEKITEGF